MVTIVNVFFRPLMTSSKRKPCAIQGENRTLVTHLSYGILEQQTPTVFVSVIEAVAVQDHHWRLMTVWLSQRWASSLSSLDDMIYLGPPARSQKYTMVGTSFCREVCIFFRFSYCLDPVDEITVIHCLSSMFSVLPVQII